MTPTDPIQELKDFVPTKSFFVGVDSDGCVFDTMELKHKECFIPNIIKHWQLQAVSKYARETSEFVNLYSQWRGVNRWPALIKVFDLLTEREEVKQRHVEIPRVQPLRDWIDRETKLSNAVLVEQIQKTQDPVLQKALTWSEAVNASIADMVKGVAPFPYMRESMTKLNSVADTIVVSQTPDEALIREWQEHDIDKFVKIICGQERGSKTEHVRLTAGGKYEPDHMLVIGDAPGDMKAARANGVLFYPINPGDEEASWQRFYEEALDCFIQGRYAGKYEQKLVEEFNAHLPDTPPWQKKGKCC